MNETNLSYLPTNLIRIKGLSILQELRLFSIIIHLKTWQNGVG